MLHIDDLTVTKQVSVQAIWANKLNNTLQRVHFFRISWNWQDKEEINIAGDYLVNIYYWYWRQMLLGWGYLTVSMDWLWVWDYISIKGPSKIVNIFPCKQKSCNFLFPPLPVMTDINILGVVHFRKLIARFFLYSDYSPNNHQKLKF